MNDYFEYLPDPTPQEYNAIEFSSMRSPALKMEFLGRYTNVRMKEYFDNAPDGIVEECENKETAVVIVSKKKYPDFFMDFPLPYYRIVAWIDDFEEHIYVGKNMESIFENVDKIIVPKDKDAQTLAIIDKYKIPDTKQISFEYVDMVDYKHVLKVRFGDRNGDKRFFVVGPVEAGILWHRNCVSMIVSNPRLEGYNVYVDMMNYPSVCMYPAELGRYNPWNYYFKQATSESMNEIYHSADVTFHTKLRAGGSNKKVIDYSDLLSNKIDSVKKEVVGTKKGILGIHYRGTDFFITKWHTPPFEPHFARYIIDEYMRHYSLKYILMDTEDEEALSEFKEIYGDKLLFMPRTRFKRGIYLPTFIKSQPSFYTYLSQRDYIIETILLATNSDYIIMGGGSSGSLIRSLFNNDDRIIPSVLLRHMNNLSRVPVIVESHNKNRLFMEDKFKPFDGSCSISIINGSELKIEGECSSKKPLIIGPLDIRLRRCTDYVFSTSSPIPEGISISARCVDSNGRILDSKSSIYCNNEIVSVSIVIDFEKDLLLNTTIGLQLEEGKFSTPYERARCFKTEIGVRDSLGLFYKPNSVNSIDLETGTIRIGNRCDMLFDEEFKLYNRIPKIPGGYEEFEYDGKKYYSRIIQRDANETDSNEVDWEWFMEPYMTNDYFRFKSFIRVEMMAIHDDLAIQAQGEELMKCHPEKYINIARLLRDGKGVKQNFKKSAYWMRKAFDRDSRLLNEYIDVLWKVGTREANSESFALASSFAEKGDGNGMLQLGRAYRDGRGTPRNMDVAAYWMRKAVEKNVGWAKNELFDILWRIGTPDSYKEMIDVATAFAEAGDGNAMGRMGRAHRDGKGVEQNLILAADWMRKASNKNIGWAKNELFDILWRIGTSESYKEMIDVATAFAEAGDGAAMGRLGRAYRDGKGVEQNLNVAADWMRKAIEKKWWSRNELFDVLWRIGTPESYKEMIDVVTPYVEAGDGGAMGRLGRAYRDGKGVEQNLILAADWMRKAADKKVDWAIKELKEMEFTK